MHGALWRCIPRNGAAFRLEPWRGQWGGLLETLGPASSNAEHRRGPSSLSHLWQSPLMWGWIRVRASVTWQCPLGEVRPGT